MEWRFDVQRPACREALFRQQRVALNDLAFDVVPDVATISVHLVPGFEAGFDALCKTGVDLFLQRVPVAIWVAADNLA